jgi:mycothiol system anti-sigma-R factor
LANASDERQRGGLVSCGKPHETHCAEVLAEVWLFLDHECDAERRRLLERHLDECTPCLAEYGLDEKLKKLLATKCSGEHAPDGLPSRSGSRCCARRR